VYSASGTDLDTDDFDTEGSFIPDDFEPSYDPMGVSDMSSFHEANEATYLNVIHGFIPHVACGLEYESADKKYRRFYVPRINAG
jgi:hypothetical protein